MRSRLVAVYTLMAILLGLAGVFTFTALLRRGVMVSFDATLQARAAPYLTVLRSAGTPVFPGPAVSPRPVPPAGAAQGGAGSHVPEVSTADAFAAVYRPNGSIATLAPVELRRSPLPTLDVLAARRAPRSLTLKVGETSLRVATIPVVRPGGTWVVAVGASSGPATDAANEAIRELQLALPLLILVAAVSAWLLSGAALRPVERMRADAENLGDRDPANRLSVPDTTDDLARLALTFNALLDRLHRSLARQRDLIADAGHEMRTPLSVLRTELELADGPGRTRDDLAESIAHARSEVERLSAVAENLLFLARADSTTPIVALVEMDLVTVATDAVRAARASAEQRAVALRLVAPVAVGLQGDPAALRRVLDNLVANALSVTPAGGSVEVSALRSRGRAVLAVDDSGPGFPEPFLDHVFERFRRPDGARSTAAGGAGLGLAIVAEIARAHGGTVYVTNRPGGGASVAVELPVSGPAGHAVSGGAHRFPMSTDQDGPMVPSSPSHAPAPDAAPTRWARPGPDA